MEAMMTHELVLFDDPENNITVTNERYIVGDEVVGIGSLSHAACVNENGFKDYALAALFGVVGLLLVLTFSWWAILGLLLLTLPMMVFLGKKKYLLFVFTRSGDALSERGDIRTHFTKQTAQGLATALNTAIRDYRAANDPRANLDL
jgi:hypothetical protein